MWDVLAIAPTNDPKVIRRAYAARLKQIDPDRDRETFARLRQALEWALACAKPARPPGFEPADDPQRTEAADLATASAPRGHPHRFAAAPLPASGASPAPGTADRARERALLLDLEAALRAKDTHAAVRLFVRAAASGALRLGETEPMLARLFTVALEDERFDGAAFRGLARSFGWDRATQTGAAISGVHGRVTARLAAEEWHDQLVALADWRTTGVGLDQFTAARLMLGRVRGRGLLFVRPSALRRLLGELRPHEFWLRDRILPSRVQTLERQLQRRGLFVVTLLVAGLLPTAISMFAMTASRHGYSLGTHLAFGVVVLLAWALWRMAGNLLSRVRSPEA
jgi:hypothetical protein